MNLCSEGHEEVCYEGRICPACDLKEDYESKIEELQDDLKEREEQNERGTGNSETNGRPDR